MKCWSMPWGSPRPAALAAVVGSALWIGASACQKSEPVVKPPLEAAAPSEAVPADAPPAEKPPAAELPLFEGKGRALPIPPEQLYADCKTRVEGADRAGECQADADCQRAGCSQELCISAAEAKEGVMSTCEMRPCFEVLEACGCSAGVCSWTVGG